MRSEKAKAKVIGGRTVSPQMRLFALEYMTDLNGKAAAIRAGYSPASAAQQAHRLMSHPWVMDEIGRAMDARAKRVEITADDVLREIAAMAFSDLRSVAKWGSRPAPEDADSPTEQYIELLDSDELSPVVSSAIAEVSQGQAGLRVKMHDKVRSLELLGKHLKMFVDRTEHDVTDRLADAMRAARERSINAPD